MVAKTYKVFVVNSGSTSTKVALFEGRKKVFQTNVNHPVEELAKCPTIQDQIPLRIAAIEKVLVDENISLEGIDAVSALVGSLTLLEGGVYEINDQMLEDSFTTKYVKHPAALGAMLAKKFQEEYGGKIFTVNPPDVDEMDDYEHVCGFHEFARYGGSHTLNMKECIIRYAESVEKKVQDINMIVCNLGGGVCVGAQRKGQLCCVNNGIAGDGPMAPTRSGWLPADQLVKMCFSGNYSEKEIMGRITKTGGLTDHLGTADAREIVERIKGGDKYAELIYNAFIYQIAKAAGGCAAALKGDVDGIIITGGIAHDAYLVQRLTEYIQWIAPVTVMPGEYEMEGLASGAIRVLSGEEKAKVYTGKAVWHGFECAPAFDQSKDQTQYY